MTRKHITDAKAQTEAEAGSAQTPDAQAYAVLFQQLDALPTPEPDASIAAGVLDVVQEARRRRQRDRAVLSALLMALGLLLLVATGLSIPQLTQAVGAIPLLYPFSVLSVVLVGAVPQRMASR